MCMSAPDLDPCGLRSLGMRGMLGTVSDQDLFRA